MEQAAAIADSSDRRRSVDRALVVVSERHAGQLPGSVGEAVRYSLIGGKRVRGTLLLAAYAAAGGTGDAAELAAAIEIVHAYSLVHDDLPCMDDDDMRRGRPSVHRAFGVPVATAAGLAMVPLAVRVIVDASDSLKLDAMRRAVAVRLVMRAAGAGGMIGGQLLDLMGEGQPLSIAQLDEIHRGKTAALIAAAARLGGMAAGAGDTAQVALRSFGSAVGLAFQITDDVLDVTSTSDTLGKTAGRDVALNKRTYPTLIGVPAAEARARALVEEACAGLSAEGLLTPELREIAGHVVDRQS